MEQGVYTHTPASTLSVPVIWLPLSVCLPPCMCLPAYPVQACSGGAAASAPGLLCTLLISLYHSLCRHGADGGGCTAGRLPAGELASQLLFIQVSYCFKTQTPSNQVSNSADTGIVWLECGPTIARTQMCMYLSMCAYPCACVCMCVQVGVRKRKAQSRWDWLEQQAAAGGWMVPPERALVPMSVYKGESLRES